MVCFSGCVSNISAWWYSGKLTPAPSSLITSPSNPPQLVHIPLALSALVQDAGNLCRYGASTPPSTSCLQVIHSPKHIHQPLGIPMSHISQWHCAVWERSLLTLGSLNHSLLRGPMLAAVTTIPVKIQDGQYMTEWLRLEKVCRLFLFPLSLHFKLLFRSFSLPGPSDNLGGVSFFLILPQKNLYLKGPFCRNYKHGTEPTQTAAPMHSHTGFPYGLRRSRQQMKGTGIQADPWLLLQLSIQGYKAMC